MLAGQVLTAEELDKLCSQHAPEWNQTLDDLQAQDQESLALCKELDEMVRTSQHPPDGQARPSPEQLARVRTEAQGKLNKLVTVHERMATLGQRAYAVVDKQVQQVDVAKDANAAAIAALQERIDALTPIDLSPNSVQQLAAPRGARASRAGTGKGSSKAKGGKDAAALPPPGPLIPAHFKPYTFKFPGMEPFEEYVDSTELVFCSCQQPSQGRMIGCDGERCKFEWFHDKCVGIAGEVPDTWYCQDCIAAGDGAS